MLVAQELHVPVIELGLPRADASAVGETVAPFLAHEGSVPVLSHHAHQHASSLAAKEMVSYA